MTVSIGVVLSRVVLPRVVLPRVVSATPPSMVKVDPVPSRWQINVNVNVIQCPRRSVVLNSNMAETLDAALSFLAARGPSAPALKSSEPEVEYVFVGLEPGSTAQLSSEIILKVRGCPPTHARTLTLAHDRHHHHHHYHRRRRSHHH